MYVDLRTSGVRLSRARAHALLLRVRAAFTSLAAGVTRIVVRVTPGQDGVGSPVRDCEIEVHLADGHVELVRERRRRLGAVLARALVRAWHLARRRLGGDPPAAAQLRLSAPLHGPIRPLARRAAEGAR